MIDTEELKILSDLVAIKSVNDNEILVAKYLQKLLGEHGISSRLLEYFTTRADLFAEIGTGHPILAICGHMDVVSPGELDQWHTDPFKLTNKDGKLYGRGATDMKSGLAALVIAMINIHEHHLIKHGSIRLLATFGEEVGEPSGYSIAIAHKGSMDIKLTSQGKEAHSSMPEKGYNAIDPLMDLLVKANKAFRETDKNNPDLGKLTFNTTVFTGGEQVNMIPGEATAQINVRTIPEFNNSLVEKKLTELVKAENAQGAKIKMDIYMSEPSIKTDGKSEFVKLAQKIGAKYAEKPIPTVAIKPVTDASNLIADKGPSYPFAMFGPGNDTPHQVNEYVDEKMYLNFVKIYTELFVAYLNK